VTTSPSQAQPPEMRRLVFVRYLYRLGTEQSRAIHPLSAAAVLTFHDSVELFLTLAAEKVSAGSKKETGFMEYFGLIDAKLQGTSLSRRQAMSRLNLSRVALKHSGIETSQSDIDGYREEVAAFFQENTPKIFQIDLDSVSLAYLIVLPAVREALIEADRLFAEGRLEDALQQIALAFARALEAYGIEGSAGHNFPVGAYDEDQHELVRAVNEVRKNVANLELEVTFLRHGIDVRRLAAFRMLTPQVTIMAAGNPVATSWGGKPPATPEHVRFCYDFVVDSIFQIQGREARLAELLVEDRFWR
jgi:hypothetical protein